MAKCSRLDIGSLANLMSVLSTVLLPGKVASSIISWRFCRSQKRCCFGVSRHNLMLWQQLRRKSGKVIWSRNLDWAMLDTYNCLPPARRFSGGYHTLRTRYELSCGGADELPSSCHLSRLIAVRSKCTHPDTQKNCLQSFFLRTGNGRLEGGSFR